MRVIHFPALLALILLSGCTQSALPKENFSEIRASTPNKASVYLYSTSGCPIPGGWNANLYINNRNLMHIGKNQYTYFELIPGHYKLSASTDVMRACNGTFNFSRTAKPLTFVAKPGKTYFIYYGYEGIRAGMLCVTCGIHLGLTSQEIAVTELPRLTKVKNLLFK